MYLYAIIPIENTFNDMRNTIFTDIFETHLQTI